MTTALMTTTDTAVGPFTSITTRPEDGVPAVVLASGWTDDPGLLTPQVAKTLRPTELRKVATITGVTDAVIRYHDGDLAAIQDVAVHQKSGPFRTHSWDVLRTVKPGKPLTYSTYAVLAGRPTAIRAAAGACAANAVALFVPCHRVLRLDGSLGGFRWGLPVKRWLLDHEAGTD